MLSRFSQRGLVRRTSSPLASIALAAPSTSTPSTRAAPAANGLQHRRGISDLALLWSTTVLVPAIVTGWSPTPVKRSPLAAHDASGDFFNKPKDAPPGWLPRPAWWQPGMPELPLMYNVIPPREGFRQWQSWEAWFYYMCAWMVGAYWYFYLSPRYKTEKQGEYWLMRVATDYIPAVKDLPLINPFDALDEGVEHSIWYDRYAMTYWASRFNELTPQKKENYWKYLKDYVESREEFQKRLDMVLGDSARVDMETLSFAFIEESNAFIDQIKIRVMNRIALLGRGDMHGQSYDYWKRQIHTLRDRRLDSPTRSPETKSSSAVESDEDKDARMTKLFESVDNAWYERTNAWLKFQEWRLRQPSAA